MCKLIVNTLNKSRYYVQTFLGVSIEQYSNKDLTNTWIRSGNRICRNQMSVHKHTNDQINRTSNNGFHYNESKLNKNMVNTCNRICRQQTYISTIPNNVPQQIPTALPYLKQDSQYLKHPLHWSVGKLENGMCVFYVTLWTFNEGGVTTMNTNSVYTLPITSRSTGVHTEIKHLQIKESFAYLGYIWQPNGN